MFKRFPNSLHFRLILAASFWFIVGFSVGGYSLAEFFDSYVKRNFDSQLDQTLDGIVAKIEVLDSKKMVLKGPIDPRFDNPYSGWYWQLQDHQGNIERSRSLWDQTLSNDLKISGFRYEYGPNNQNLRVTSRLLHLKKLRDSVLLQVAIDDTGVRKEIARFNRFLIWSLVIFGFGLIGAVFFQVRIGLRPLSVVKDGLARIRAGSSDKLDGNFPVEIAPLVYEVNALLDNNRRLVGHARREAGDLAHALKTPLTILANEANQSSDLFSTQVTNQVAAMRRHVDHHLARAHATAGINRLGAVADVELVIKGLLRVMRQLHAAKGVYFSANLEKGLIFGGEQQDLEEILGNLIDNGGKWAAGTVSIKGFSDQKQLRIIVEDDGPGLSVGVRKNVLERGRRLDETIAGAGLGLSIVANLVELYGGKMELGDSPNGGLQVKLALPLHRSLID